MDLDGYRRPGDPYAMTSEHNDYSRPHCSEQRDGAMCTRRAQHDGQHEAAGSRFIVAVWA